MFNYNLFLNRLSKRKLYSQSFIKNEIAQRLLKRLEFIKLDPKDILVTGYSDNNYVEKLHKRFPKADIHTNQNLKQQFDIIFSNSIIHLTDNLSQELDNYYQLLNDNGILLFSTFGDKSFATLTEAFASVSNHKHTNNMIDLLTWGNTLQSSQYKTPAIESDLITFTYENINTLFNDIRHLNEPLADTSMHLGLTGKNMWYDFVEKFKQNLKLEIEALYGYAIRKTQDNTLKSRANSNRISLEELKKQIADFKKNS
ncbi:MULTISPECIES: methyltransferase domain-containing protein [Francisella]|uniref:Methyltransferase domain-containing protein n=1 Tax=Francisella opportunistica TaxID=2016517 RepID=A0A345JSK6_9GAMM|nr:MULTISPECIES: methyltransferase domain-containing protein [Francisella]APC92072.1 Biotin synthesis protein BioC [Francisella sp. MA067296]AXH30302.1 methyltransferase domain-containing protein [Francisella opportunistica]AXH31943.1 biotin synthase [Francisella opportunistica]AXH33589.1 biotin synthase [Francisella opportunistica]